jgi:hypothetical protein
LYLFTILLAVRVICTSWAHVWRLRFSFLEPGCDKMRKLSKPDEVPRPRYNDNQRSYPKLVHNIDSDGYMPLENWEKNFGTPLQ